MSCQPAAAADRAADAARGAEAILRNFFDALKAHDCTRARQLRPDYPLDRCREVRDARVEQAAIVNTAPGYAIAQLKVEIQIGEQTTVFDGHALLTSRCGEWKIETDSFSAEKNLERYLAWIRPWLPGAGDGGLSFGSETVLCACWSPAELRGSPEESRVQRPWHGALRQPPGATEPRERRPALPDSLRNSIRRVEPRGGEKVVALTFDVCERALERTGYDAGIVNYLRDHQVRATFFLGGKWMQTHPERAMQLMADPSFEVGNHAWTHGNLRVLGVDRVRQQILWPQVQYELLWDKLKAMALQHQVDVAEAEKIPHLPLTFRFPYGVCRPEALQSLAEWGLPAIQWDVVTGDPDRHTTAEAIAQLVNHKVRPGSIIVCHANGRAPHTAAALPLFIPQLRRAGYRFVTVSELLAMGPAVTATECYENRPGDNKRYDRLFGAGDQ
jgi:peptidoglycan/xylan/chitin deacetylase (PgdA/CDA1 family)